MLLLLCIFIALERFGPSNFYIPSFAVRDSLKPSILDASIVLMRPKTSVGTEKFFASGEQSVLFALADEFFNRRWFFFLFHKKLC